MQRGVRNLKENPHIKTTFICLSNANSVFIGTILKVCVLLRHATSNVTVPQDKAFEDIFEEIITNPAEWMENGALIVRRRIPPDGPQHSCSVGCSPNMCKGKVSLIPHTLPRLSE